MMGTYAMARQIFRKEALDRLASPEQLDQLMRVARPRAWVALAAVGLVLITALLWGFFGTIPTTVETQGVLLRRGGVATVTAPIAGAVTDVSVMSGDGVADGQELLRLAPDAPRADAVEVPVRSPFAARVLQRSIREGQDGQGGRPAAGARTAGRAAAGAACSSPSRRAIRCSRGWRCGCGRPR